MVYRESFQVKSQFDGLPTFHNVTEEVNEIVKRSKIENGIVIVYSRHTTCSVITEESAFDLSMTGLETIQQDLVNVFEKVIPTYRSDGEYLHPGEQAIKFAEEHDESLRCCHNTDAHLRSSIIGRSETIIIINGEIDTGDYGHIYFIDWDQTRARERTVQVMAIG